QLEAVPFRERTQHSRVGRGDASQRDEFGEELFEAGRGDDLDDSCGLVAGIPERVPLVARLEDQVTGSAEHHVVAKQRADASLDDVAVLVLTRVTMERCRQRAR